MVLILFILFAIVIVLVLSFYIFFKYTCVKCESNVCLVGKTALVTGGSSGIGYHTVLSLASRGCRVIIADRIVNEDIKKSIIDETDNSNIILKYVDFASFKSVRNFAENLKNSEEKLDILINNVGIGICGDKPTEDGLNMTMQINYYSPFLLTHLLVDLLKKSSDARVLFTTSLMSFLLISPVKVASKIIKDARYRAFDYANSKFCTVIASDMFAEKLKKYNIKSNCYQPGAVKTNIFDKAKKYFNVYNIFDIGFYLMLKIGWFVFETPQNACQTAVHMVVSKHFKNVTGTFFGVFSPNLKPKGTENKQYCQQMWEASENMVQLKPEEKL